MKPTANGVGTNLSHPGRFGPDTQTIDQQWAAMDGRFNNTALIIKKEHATKDLQEFLEAANQHLKTKQSDATDVAHFLMGKNENLPQGLSEPGKKIPPETKKYLYDILRTNRYGAFGLKEPIAKTIAKLTQLQALVSREVDKKIQTIQIPQSLLQKQSSYPTTVAVRDPLANPALMHGLCRTMRQSARHPAKA